MKKILYLALLLTPLLSGATVEPQKIALLVAVGDYPAETGWGKINSLNDVPPIKQMLLAKGFEAQNIYTLVDKEATREGILAAIHTTLLDKVRKGDAVYFQFSGHGQQVADDNGDEVEGYDEAIVPYNSPKFYQTGVYEGKNLIRDDELGTLFEKLRRKLGPAGHLMVILDACHSGTGTRGLSAARGTSVIMADSAYIARQDGSNAAEGSFLSSSKAEPANLAPMVAFFGAAHNQLNYEAKDDEGRLMGSLSYALSKKMSLAGSTTTYRGLFDEVRREMSNIAPLQQPQAEGQLDQEVLGGRILDSPNYLNVKSWQDATTLVVSAGWLQNVNDGSVIGFFPPETRDPQKATPVVKGRVSRGKAVESFVTLENSIGEEEALGLWAYVLEQNFGTLHINVKLGLPAEDPFAQALTRRLAKYPVTFTDDAELFILPEGSPGARGAAPVQLLTKDDQVLENSPAQASPERAAQQFVDRILAYARADFLRKLENTSYDLRTEFELVFYRYDSTSQKIFGEIPSEQITDASGNVHVKAYSTAVKARISNRGSRPAYVTLIDLRPDNVVSKESLLMPGPFRTPEEYRIEPGKTIESEVFLLEPPMGTEVFKLLATDQPIDLRPVLATQGTGTRGVSNQNPLEQLVGQTFFNEDLLTRGGRTTSLATGGIHTFTQNFVIE
jgi:hypothetical protein